MFQRDPSGSLVAFHSQVVKFIGNISIVLLLIKIFFFQEGKFTPEEYDFHNVLLFVSLLLTIGLHSIALIAYLREHYILTTIYLVICILFSICILFGTFVLLSFKTIFVFDFVHLGMLLWFWKDLRQIRMLKQNQQNETNVLFANEQTDMV